MIQIRWTWALIPLFVAIIGVQTCALVQRAGRAERAEQAAEAAGMRADDLIAEKRGTERQLRDALEDADGLREQLAKAPKGCGYLFQSQPGVFNYHADQYFFVRHDGQPPGGG